MKTSSTSPSGRIRAVLLQTLAASFVGAATALVAVWWVGREPFARPLATTGGSVDVPRAAGADVPEWGELSRVTLVTEKPGEFVDVMDSMKEATAWRFVATDRAAVRRRLLDAGLAVPTVDRLFSAAADEGGAVVLRPDDEFLLALSPQERAGIYQVLRASEASHFAVFPFSYPAGRFGAMMSGRISEATIRILERLLYRVGKADCFSDVGPALRAIGSPEACRAVLKALTRQETLLLKVALRPETDVDKLLGYWSTPGRRKDLQPLLESLTRVPGGTVIDAVHLLPAFARQRLYTYPDKVKGASREYDCHWTSLNFFRREVDMSLLDSARVAEVLETEYEVVPGPARLGDVILYTTDGSNVVHSCVYVADDVVFTKNGANTLQPWIFMTLADMEVVYPSEQPYKMVTYRLKAAV